jgi:outer membrane protein TolC
MLLGCLISMLVSIPTLAQTKGGAGIRLSYEDLPRLVKEKNENVQAARSTLSANERRTGRLARSFLPSLNAHIGQEDFKTGPDPRKSQEYWKIGASINLYRGGRDRLEENYRESQVRKSQSEYSREFNDELKEARQAYWRLVAINLIIRDQEEAVNKNDLNLKSARRRTGAGVASNSDSVQFELQKSILTQNLKKMRLERDLIRNNLSVAIAVDEHESISVQEDFSPPDTNDFKSADLKIEEQLEYKIGKETEKSIALKKSQASRWWAPQVDVYANYGLPSLSDEYTRALDRHRETAVGIKLEFDINQGAEDFAESRARSFDEKSAGYRAAHRTREVVASDHELRHDLTLLGELIRDSNEDVKRAERFFKLTENEYARGVKNGPDLLQAFERLYGFRERRVSLNRDYQETKAELMSLNAKEESL